MGLWGWGQGLAVPGEPVVELVQVSAQEYGERHEAELQRKETLSEPWRASGHEREVGRWGF